MAALRPRLEVEGCLFVHVEPWLDPERIEDLWYFDDEPWYTVVDPVLPSLWYDGCCSLGPRSHGEHRPLFLGGGTDRPCGLRLPFTRPGGLGRFLTSPHEFFHLHDRKPLRHQRGQLVPIFAQMIQHLRHRRLHRLERLVPAVQCLLPQELP